MGPLECRRRSLASQTRRSASSKTRSPSTLVSASSARFPPCKSSLPTLVRFFKTPLPTLCSYTPVLFPALRLKCIRDFLEDDGSKEGIKRIAGDEWLFEGTIGSTVKSTFLTHLISQAPAPTSPAWRFRSWRLCAL